MTKPTINDFDVRDIPLKSGDVWKDGDYYGSMKLGFKFVIGTPSTGAKSGDTVSPAQMCYEPKRPFRNKQ